MKESIKIKLENLVDRYEEIAGLLSDPEIINDQNKFRGLSKEYSQIEPTVQLFAQFQQLIDDKEAAQEMLHDDDKEIVEMGKEELETIDEKIEENTLALQKLLIPKDPHDDSNIFLEIRAGTGGDEAAIFSGDLFKMYSRYFDSQKWRIEILRSNEGDHGGYKEIIGRVIGHGAYSQLKFESGAHRVQRVPATESQGRVHTSACTVAVLPELDQVEAIDVNPADLRIDTFRASGAGGQHVNKTDSAIRITHLPSGIVVECQDERSQHKNKARAMSLLQSKLLTIEQDKQQSEQASQRKSLVGSGDRSERIRTYNYPQGRVTDHRINLTLYKLPEIMEGDLDSIIKPLINEYQADQLAALSNDD